MANQTRNAQFAKGKMRCLSTHKLRIIALLSSAVLAAPTSAANANQYLTHFGTVPIRGDAIWQSKDSSGAPINFEKQVQCLWSTQAPSSHTWPPVNPLGGGGAHGPLFLNPDSDGHNPIYWPSPGPTKTAPTLVCRATILANGVDVTADIPSRVNGVSTQLTFGSVDGTLDRSKLAKLISGTPNIYRTGFVDLKQTWTLDLDTGVTGVKLGADIWFEAGPWPHFYFVPQNGAVISIEHPTASLGDRPQQYSDCSAQHMDTNRRPAILNVGTYYCVRTSEGRLAEFEIAKVTGSAAQHQPYVLSLHYTVWTK